MAEKLTDWQQKLTLEKVPPFGTGFVFMKVLLLNNAQSEMHNAQ